MHVAIFVDMEGAFGIWRRRQCHPGTPEWQYGRACLTDDVNAAIQGAFDGGASAVTVKDTHGLGYNCLAGKLDPRARYLGGHYIVPSLFGDVSGYDLALHLGIHASAGTPDAFFPHTYSGAIVQVRVNGTPRGETELMAAYLGELGIPVGFVSGDKTAVDQARAFLPWVERVVVDKREATYASEPGCTHCLHQGRQELRARAEAAVDNAGAMRSYAIPGPLQIELEFRSPEEARKHNSWGYARRGGVLEFAAPDMVGGHDLLCRAAFYPRMLLRVRRPTCFAIRAFCFLRYNYFVPRPQPKPWSPPAQLAVSD